MSHFKKAGPGRPPKPIAMRIADGTYDPEKHGVDPMPTMGSPVMPAHLAGDAKDLWELVVPTMVKHGIAGEIDAPELTIMCEFWAEYRRVMKWVQSMDVKHPKYGKMLFTAGTANTNFNNAAAKFGMTPSDRAKLGVDLKEKKASGVQPRKRDA